MTLAETIRAAHRADDDFESIVRAYGYRSRWDWDMSKDPCPEILDYYDAKVAADNAMHTAFEESRKSA